MLADKIKSLRKARGWTQAELGQKISLSRTGINAWEQGLSMPSPAMLVELAKVFAVSTDYLLGLDSLATIDVSGLSETDVAILAELAERLRNNKTN